MSRDPDDDDNPAFYPPPELEEYYEMEEEVAPQVLGYAAVQQVVQVEDTGNISEELYAPRTEEGNRRKKGRR